MARTPVASILGATLLLAVALTAAGKVRAAPDAEDRVLRAAEGSREERAADGRFDAGAFAEVRTTAEDVAALSKGRGPSVAQALSVGDHWIYDADAVLYDDFDNDGFFRFLSIRVDADTVFDQSFVYAVIYLSDDGENFEHFYTTSDFEINSATADDEFFVETELVSGYPPGYYDVIIELYDADLGLYMDEFGPAQSEALELLPLEDARFDEPAGVVVVHEEGGGGSISLWTLLGLLGVALARSGVSRRFRRSRAKLAPTLIGRLS
jgi:hypothetical protein